VGIRARKHPSRTVTYIIDAQVGVIDVAVDDVGDRARRMLAGADAVGEPPEQHRRGLAIEAQRLGAIHAAAGRDLVCELLNGHVRNSHVRRTPPCGAAPGRGRRRGPGTAAAPPLPPDRARSAHYPLGTPPPWRPPPGRGGRIPRQSPECSPARRLVPPAAPARRRRSPPRPA